MPKTTKDRLIRCICGKVYALSGNKVCPDCGHKMEIAVKKDSEVRTKQAPKENPPAPKPQINLSGLPWKWIAAAAGILAVMFFISRLFSSGQKMTTTQARETAVFGEPFGSEIQGVDEAIAGTWRLYVPAVQGVSYWELKINKNSTYSFEITGNSPGQNHKGSFKAENGTWFMDSRTSDWSDGGSYRVINGNVLVLTGKLGTGTWQRTG